MFTSSEENYIKTIYKLALPKESGMVSTNEIADAMQTAAPSVTDMVKRLAGKKLVEYRPYQGARLTEEGSKNALRIIRKHRLWEVFLVRKLGFNWDEVHEVAEQLEHIRSEKLIDAIDEMLGYPEFDPHGDPIPQKDGSIHDREKILMTELNPGQGGVVVKFGDTSDNFLRYLDKIGISLGSKIIINDKIEFDGSMVIELEGAMLTISKMVSENIFVSK